jgi:hypothetical protein
MPDEYCFGILCFVPLTEPSPGVFGLQHFIPGLALMAIAWTTSDARYRFRVASAALPVRTITFWVLASVGPLTLLTSMWHAQHWLVPRGNVLTPATWEALLGFAFIGTFLLWAWVAFVQPPVFSRRNANRYADAFYVAVLRGRDLPEIVFELASSVTGLVRFATDKEERRRRKLLDPNSKDDEVSDVEVCANQVLLLMADRKVCRTIVESSPITAITLFEEVSRTKRFGVPVDILGKNLISEALKSRDSFLFTETEGYETGLLGFHKPLTQAMFSDFALVEGVRNLLDLDWKQARDLDSQQWEAYCRVLLTAFAGYVERKAPEHSTVIYSALQELKHATSGLYKLDGRTEDWDQPSWEKLHVVVRFIQDAMRALDRLGRPNGVSLRLRLVGSPQHDIYDALSKLIFEIIWNAAAVTSPVDLCWSIQHNSVWAEFFGSDDRNGPVAQIVKRKLMAQIYHEINELKTFPNFKGARYLGFCLNVMGLTLNRQPFYRDSFPLQRAMLRWTKKNFALLRQRNSEVADDCLVAGMSFDEQQSRIVKCYPVEGLRRQAQYVYLPVDPAPATAPPFEAV